MKEILSNQSVAQRVAKELENALESIHKHQINYAEQTTIRANARAKEVIEVQKSIVNEFALALKQYIDRIQTVASEFEATDQILGDSFLKK